VPITQRGQLEATGAEVIEARGMTLMPGLVEGHAHITFINGARPTDLGDTPPEEHTLAAARNARVLLDHGFTSAYSAASAKLRVDVVIRNAIEAGDLPGPRMRACGPEITVTGGLGDERRAHQFRDSFAMFADGPLEVMGKKSSGSSLRQAPASSHSASWTALLLVPCVPGTGQNLPLRLVNMPGGQSSCPYHVAICVLA